MNDQLTHTVLMELIQAKTPSLHLMPAHRIGTEAERIHPPAQSAGRGGKLRCRRR
ncbi:MAG: hypothetical protein R2851_07255 [Caldilineaceae bacterium]